MGVPLIIAAAATLPILVNKELRDHYIEEVKSIVQPIKKLYTELVDLSGILNCDITDMTDMTDIKKDNLE